MAEETTEQEREGIGDHVSFRRSLTEAPPTSTAEEQYSSCKHFTYMAFLRICDNEGDARSENSTKHLAHAPPAVISTSTAAEQQHNAKQKPQQHQHEQNQKLYAHSKTEEESARMIHLRTYVEKKSNFHMYFSVACIYITISLRQGRCIRFLPRMRIVGPCMRQLLHNAAVCPFLNKLK